MKYTFTRREVRALHPVVCGSDPVRTAPIVGDMGVLLLDMTDHLREDRMRMPILVPDLYQGRARDHIPAHMLARTLLQGIATHRVI